MEHSVPISSDILYILSELGMNNKHWIMQSFSILILTIESLLSTALCLTDKALKTFFFKRFLRMNRYEEWRLWLEPMN